MLKKILLLVAVLFPTGYTEAQNYAAGQLSIEHPWSMELPPNAPTVAAYFVIRNRGQEADRLNSVDSPIAGTAQLHENLKHNGLIKMQQIQTLDIAAGSEVKFVPMAYHVMLLDLKDRSMLTEGQTFPLTLHFEKAGDVTVEVMVRKQAPDAIDPAHDH